MFNFNTDNTLNNTEFGIKPIYLHTVQEHIVRASSFAALDRVVPVKVDLEPSEIYSILTAIGEQYPDMYALYRTVNIYDWVDAGIMPLVVPSSEPTYYHDTEAVPSILNADLNKTIERACILAEESVRRAVADSCYRDVCASAHIEWNIDAEMVTNSILQALVAGYQPRVARRLGLWERFVSAFKARVFPKKTNLPKFIIA